MDMVSYSTICVYFSERVRNILPIFCKEVGMIFSICSMYKDRYLLTLNTNSLYIVFSVEYNPGIQLLVAPFSPCILVKIAIENINEFLVHQEIGNVYVGNQMETMQLKKKIENTLVNYFPNAEFIKFFTAIQEIKKTIPRNQTKTRFQQLFSSYCYSGNLKDKISTFL
jgi:hypothetical protein